MSKHGSVHLHRDFRRTRRPAEGRSGVRSDEASLVAPQELRSPQLTDPWRRFAEARSNPFLTPEWTHAWLGSHPEEEPFAIAWRRDGALRGVLPLVAVRVGPATMLQFAGGRRADWTGPACLAEDETAMAEACVRVLERERRSWHAVRFDRVDEETAWPQALRSAAHSPLLAGVPGRRDVLPYIRFDERGYEGYLAGHSRNFRSQLGRHLRRLQRNHDLRFRLCLDPADLSADLGAFFRLHYARWADRGGSSWEDPAVRDHHRRFAAAALERGWLRLWIAEADGAPAAAWYGWRIGERYCYALAGFDPAYEHEEIGNVLLGHTIEAAAAEGARIYDLMWGDEEYKRRFETDRRSATSWTYGRRNHVFGLAAGASMRLWTARDSLPGPVRRPLARLLRSVRG